MNRYTFLNRFSGQHFLVRIFVLVGLITLILPMSASMQPQPLQAAAVSFAAFGDFGGNNASEAAVANMVDSWGPDFIVTTGDNSYGSTAIDLNIGQYYSDYIGNYVGTYGPGSATDRFFPAVGNHDYTDGGGITAHYNYFTLPGNERYYDFVQGPVHFFVIDSNPAGTGSAPGDGRSETSAQAVWLQAGLAASTAPWKIVTMHHPPYSSGNVHGSEIAMQWPYEEWGATAVFAGHDHVYERILRDDNSDGADFAYFTTGAGGKSLYGFNTVVAGSQVRYSSNYGSMLVTASDSEITYEFWSITDGGTLIDTYTMTAPPPTPSWKAYNDLAAYSNTTPDGHFTFITTDTGGVAGLPNSDELVKFADGSGTGVTLTVSGGEFNGSSHVDTYTGGPVAGEAATLFSGIPGLDDGANFNALGTISYQEADSPAGDLVLSFDGMDPGKTYNLVFFGNRNDYGWDRAALATISNVDAFSNESSAATDNPTGTGGTLFDGPSDPSTRLPSGNANGYVARFTGIDAGSDGTMLLTISYDGTGGTNLYKGKYANAVMLEEVGGAAPDLICETFDTFTIGDNVGDHADWFDGGGGPIISSADGVASSQGLDPASSIFTWMAQPFFWSDADTTGFKAQMDFQTSATGQFDDDRVGWMIEPNSTNSDLIFGVQLDNAGGHLRMEGYWDHVINVNENIRVEIADLDSAGLAGDTWYRLTAEFSKLTDTSAQIDAELWLLDGSGNPVSLVAGGTIPDTSAIAPDTDRPDVNYFAGELWPAYKNHSSATGSADNACYGLSGATPLQYNLTVNIVGNGSVELAPPGNVYDAGTPVQLTADPDPGWTFDGWSGDLLSSTNPETITMDGNKTVTATFAMGPVAENWTSYVDLRAEAGDSNHANVLAIIPTGPDIQPIDPAVDWVLKDFASGADLPVTMSVDMDVRYPTTNGADSDLGTDAGLLFGGIVDGVGGYEIEDASSDYVTLTFDNLQPDKEYVLAVTNNRADIDYDNRVTQFTITGADTFVNAGSSGVFIHGEHSVSFSTGNNTTNGYVAQWTGVGAADGSFSISAIQDTSQPGWDGSKAYAMTSIMLQEVDASGPDLFCETFDTFAVGTNVGSDADWFDGGGGPIINAASGVASSQGLNPAGSIYTWTAHPFDWNDADFQGVKLQADFQTDASGHFDDDRIGWMTTDDSTSSNNIFGVQLDPGGGGYNIEAYWDGDSAGDDGGRTSIVTLPTLTGSAWYRFYAEITRLTATSARIDVTLTELDSSGNPGTVVASGSIPDTDLLPNTTGNEIPNPGYFSGTIWPAYKNHTGAPANADNSCYKVVTGATPDCYALTLDHTGMGSDPVATPANSSGCSAGEYVAGEAISLSGAVPNADWQIDSWTGTDDDSSTANANSLTMPAVPWTVYVNYLTSPTGENWTAYNDLEPRVVSGDTDNAPNVTEYDYTVSDAALVDFNSGAVLPVTITGSYNNRDPQQNGDNANAGTDSGDIFGTAASRIVDLRATSELDAADWFNTVTFNNLDPDKEYIITLSANRDNISYAGARYAKVSIEGADTYTNTSSNGVVVNSDASVSFSIGYNTVNGYVAQWFGVTAGPDGTFSVKSEWDSAQGSGDQNTKGYAMSAFKLQEVDGGTPTCHALTLDHTGLGSDPLATPANSSGCSAGEYIAGEAISLSGAVPDSGWAIDGWTGTDNNSSTADTNSLTMPAAPWTVYVNYVDTTPPDLVCETFDTFTIGANVGSHVDWFDSGGGPTISSSGGVASSQGLNPAANIFTWTAQPFDWNAADFQGVKLQADFETDASGYFDDDRIGWMTTDSSSSSNNIFGIQLDPGGGGYNIEAYWDGNTVGDDGGRTSIATLPTLVGNAWYRFGAEITRLTATSARIDVTLTELDASGNPGAVVASGSIPDTDLLPNTPGEEIPNPAYFTGPIWPAFKNYTAVEGSADNTCYKVLTGTPPVQYSLTAGDDGNGSVTLNPAGGTYNEGTTVTLTPVPDSGYAFDTWGGANAGDLSNNGDGTWNITMDADKTVNASFVALPPVDLTITIVGNGSVTLDPPGSPAGTYPIGTDVQLTANADSGWHFSGWTDDLSGSANPESITMDAGKTVTATFTETPPQPAGICEDFETGFTLGQPVGTHAEWFDSGSGPVVTSGNGLVSSIGLAPGSSIFTWTEYPFDWTDPAFESITFNMDFQSDGSGEFDDDRMGWMIVDDDALSANFFGVQLDHVDGGIVTYWRDSSSARIQTPIVPLASLSANTWFRFEATFTKLTETSARIDVSLVELDAGGNPTGAPYTGTLDDTSTWPDGLPAEGYFTADTMWPAYKNHTGLSGAADNVCFDVTSGRFAFLVSTDWHTSDSWPNADISAKVAQIANWVDNPTADMPAPEFMVITGDFPHLYQTESIFDTEIDPDFLWYPVMGNHEVSDDINNFYDIRDTKVPSLPYIVDNGPAGSVNSTYSWSFENAHFVALNGYWNGNTSAGSDTGADGDVVPALNTWISNDLASNGQTHNFAFIHEPAYPAHRHVGDSLDAHPANRDAFIATLNTYNVEAMFAGHTHYYEHDVDPEFPLGNLDQVTNGSLRVGSDTTFTYVLVEGNSTIYKVYSWNGSAFTLIDQWSIGGSLPSVPPAAPTSLAAVDVSYSQINLTWTDNANNEASFEIERSTTGSGGPFTLLTTVAADTTAYVNSGLTELTPYCYRVRAVNAAGESAYTDVSCATTPEKPPVVGICEDFDTGFVGYTVGAHPDWYDGGAGPMATAGNGLLASVGLAPANNIFTWTAQPFDWNASDFQSVQLQADFQTDGSGHFDDDRMGWMISDSSTLSSDIFGVQLDHIDGGIVTYWREGTSRIQDPIVTLPTLPGNTWYRFYAEITRLTATSARIDVTLTELDAAGNPTGVPYAGTVSDTSLWPGGVPNSTYFTTPTMWPGYKNYSAIDGSADNTCYAVVTGTPPITGLYSEDFEGYNAGDDPTDWVDTAANSNNIVDDSLFKVFDVDGNKVMGTTSTSTNIHSHYIGAGSEAWSDYRYSGRMRISDASGGIGVTFFSQFTGEDAYYRLRRYGQNAFHLSPHGTSLAGTLDSGVVPLPNIWYQFIVEIENVAGATEIRAKVWAEGDQPPNDWQIEASDSSASRFSAGRIGLWSYTSGSKYWDDLEVSYLAAPPDYLYVTPADQAVGSAAGTTSFAVSANVAWTVTESEDWLSVAPASGSDDGTLTVTYDENTGAGQRVGTINVSDGTLSVSVTMTQAGTVDAFYMEDFETYSAGDNPDGWLDTAANNSMVVADSLFMVSDVGGNMVFGTTSSLSNIHSHYVGGGSASLSGYRFTGRMLITEANGGIGVTFHSLYPNSDDYYRLRRFDDGSFHISPHGTTISGDTDTGVVPVANAWYWFIVEVEDTGAQTAVRAKVWANGSPEPADWQVDAYDASSSRISAGTFGLWSFRSGAKYWDDLEVSHLGAAPPDYLDVTPADQAVSSAAGTTSFAVSTNVAWTVTESEDWLSVAPTNGIGDGTLTVTYDENTGAGQRVGTINVSDGTLSVDVTVTQAAASDYLDVTPADQAVGSAAGTTSFAVSTNVAWTVTESEDWLSVAPASGSDDGTLTVTYDENTGAGQRVGTINVSDGTLSVSVTMTQAGTVDAFYMEDFETYSAGDNPDGWLDTAANNSMVVADSLFMVSDAGGNMAFGTTSTLSNIHSHYVGGGSASLSGYRFTGRMLITEANGGIGVTFHSLYPNSDDYYRLRRFDDGSFHISPHGTTISGDTDTGVVPVANAWYWFIVEVEDTGAQTAVRAKVWINGSPEPTDWQVDAFDASASRISAGTFGLWSFRSGAKYWDDLLVEPLAPLAP